MGRGTASFLRGDDPGQGPPEPGALPQGGAALRVCTGIVGACDAAPVGEADSAAVSQTGRHGVRSVEREAEDYQPGVPVRHRRFGRGQVVQRNGDVIVVSFQDGGRRKLSLTAALRAGQLQME